MATPGQQAAQALKSGGVRRMADSEPNRDDGVQLAGLLSTIIKNSAKSAPTRVGVEGAGKGAAGRVPEPVTESIMPEGTTKSQTQKALAPEALSPEGLERFDAAGGDAGVAIQTPTAREIDEGSAIVSEAAAQPAPNEVVTSAAQKATSPKDAVNTSNAALANEGDALDLIRMTNEEDLVDGSVGVDFNFENMTSGNDVNAVINAMSDIIKNPTEAQKRGIRTNAETLSAAGDLLADEMGVTKRLLRKKSGDLLNAEEMTAVRIILQKSAARLKDMATQINAGDGSPKLLLDFRRQMSIHAGIQMKAKGAQTEIARALQAFQIPVGQKVPQEAMIALLNESGGMDMATKMAKGYLDVLEEGGEAAANKYVFGAWAQKVEGVWMEVYINGMLSYFPTHIKNAVATPIFQTYNVFADLLTATGGTVVRAGQRAIGKEVNPDGVFFEDVFARIYGYGRSLPDALTVAGKTWRTEVPADNLNKVEAGTLRAIDSENLNTGGTAGQAIDHMGRLIRVPGRALMAADDFWRVFASRGTLYEEAIRAARRSIHAGRTDAEALDDATMVLLDPSFTGEKMDAAARYATLTDDLGDGLLGGGVKNIRGNFLGKLLLPFAKAPTNAMRRVGEGHPLIAAVSLLNKNSNIRNNLLGNNGAQAQQRAMGRLAMGSATMYYFHQMAVDGELTGSMPAKGDLREALPPGWQPYSFVSIGNAEDRAEAGMMPWPLDEDGDPLPMYNQKTGLPNGGLIYTSYQGLEPVSAFLGIAASTARHQYMFIDPEDKLDLLSAGVLATAEYFRDLPMLQAIGDIARAARDKDFTIITDGFVSGTIGAFPMPYSSAVRNIDRLENTDRRRVVETYDRYTIADVEALYKESKAADDGQYTEEPYHLVGTVKKNSDIPWAKHFHDAYLQGWETQTMNIPWVNERVENFAYSYDMLGNKKTRGVPFSVNPHLAIWNSVTPFKMSYGTDIEPYHAELIRLGAPLSEEREAFQGVKLDKIQRGDLSRIAKNEVVLNLVVDGRKKSGSFTFRDYLQVLMVQQSYVMADDDVKTNYIQNAEERFYKAALPILLSQDGNEELARVFQERGLLKKLGIK